MYVEFELGLSFDSRFDLFIQNVAFVFVELFRKHSDDAIALLALEGKENNERILREATVQGGVPHLPVNLRIGYIKDSLEGTAAERKPKSVPHQTFRAVTTDDIFRRDCLRRVVRRFDLGRNAIRVLRKTLEFGLPQNVSLLALQVFVKKSFSFALLQHQHKWKRAQSLPDVGKIELTAYLSV